MTIFVWFMFGLFLTNTVLYIKDICIGVYPENREVSLATATLSLVINILLTVWAGIVAFTLI